MGEILFLNCFLFLAFVLAPLMTKSFFLKESRVYSDAHKISLMVLFVGVVLGLNYAAVIWPLFCAFGFFLYLKNESKFIYSIEGIAICIPFIFSIISSVWFVSGVFDLHLLGYSKAWSFYAALHGAFLGWLLVGCFAFLSQRSHATKVYLWGCYLSFLFFLCIAFGIDGVPHIKRIGVIGLSVMAPFLIGYYAFNLRKATQGSKIFSAISLFAIILSMILAGLNEFWSGFPRIISGVPMMVVAHGFLNAIFAVPCFFIAIRLERRKNSNEARVNENVIFFDDLCVLCSGTVILLTKLDHRRKIKYSSLKGKFGQTLKDSGQLNVTESVVFWSDGIFYERANAVIHILIKLGGIYKIAGFALRVLPLFILNALYDMIAQNRYRMFGKNEVCLVPTEDIKNLFIL